LHDGEVPCADAHRRDVDQDLAGLRPRRCGDLVDPRVLIEPVKADGADPVVLPGVIVLVDLGRPRVEFWISDCIRELRALRGRPLLGVAPCGAMAGPLERRQLFVAAM